MSGHCTVEITDSYLLQALSVFMLSLWKTWLGPVMSAPYGFSYWEMIGWNISAAMISATVTLHFRRKINELIRQPLPKKDLKPRFRKELRRYVRFWRRYGFYGAMVLTPVLIGIPLGVWVSARLGTEKMRIVIALGVSSVMWSSALYSLASFGITFI